MTLGRIDQKVWCNKPKAGEQEVGEEESMDRTTELLSSYAYGLTYEDLSAKAVRQVKRTLIDSLGCALRGYSSKPARIARELALTVSSTTPSRVLGTRDHSSPDMAAFANGVTLRYLDCNDSYFSPGGGHPSDMIPAALALAGPMNSDGREVIVAIVLAYEVFCRLSDQVVVSDLGWDQGIFSVIGAACAASKLMRLDRDQMGHAISLAVVPNLPLGVTRTSELSMWKGCATASASRAGVFAAQLAGQGMSGPSQPFEGRCGLWAQTVGEPVKLPNLGGGDETFRISDTTFKSFPSQIHTQGPIGLALELRSQVTPADIESIHIQAYKSATSTPSSEPEKWNPKTRETADHSIPYLVAVALQYGAVTSASFTDQRIQDPALRTLIGKMAIHEDEEFTRRYPGEYNCRIEITSCTGKGFAAQTSYPKGHRLNPLNDAEVESKFRSLASSEIGEPQCDRMLEIVWSLDSSSNLNQMFDSLVV